MAPSTFSLESDCLLMCLDIRWGSKLVNDGEITFYQFMVAFMGIYFSGTAAGTLFGFAGSKSIPVERGLFWY